MLKAIGIILTTCMLFVTYGMTKSLGFSLCMFPLLAIQCLWIGIDDEESRSITFNIILIALQSLFLWASSDLNRVVTGSDIFSEFTKYATSTWTMSFIVEMIWLWAMDD